MIGIFGGTFDPVHIGHLRIALELYQKLPFEKILFVPCRQPPHRGKPVASISQRLEMLEMAIQGQDGFGLDERELRRKGPSYMVDTLDSMRIDYPDQSLCLMLGGDAFLHLETWCRWTELINLANIVVMYRPGYQLKFKDKLGELVDQHRVDSADMLNSESSGNILFQPVIQLDISASKIRTLVSSNMSARYLLPENVRLYIEAQKLYT